MNEREFLLTSETADLILTILKRGNTAEVKKENDKIVVVEIQRRVRNKTPITG